MESLFERYEFYGIGLDRYITATWGTRNGKSLSNFIEVVFTELDRRGHRVYASIEKQDSTVPRSFMVSVKAASENNLVPNEILAKVYDEEMVKFQAVPYKSAGFYRLQ